VTCIGKGPELIPDHDFRNRNMNPLVFATLSVSAVSSATGMILFRYGRRGNTTITEFFRRAGRLTFLLKNKLGTAFDLSPVFLRFL
jgi:hypothetical protein